MNNVPTQDLVYFGEFNKLYCTHSGFTPHAATALIFENIQELALHGLWCQFYHWVIKSVDDGNMGISRMLFSNIEYQWVQWNEAHQLYGGDGLAPLWLPVAVELQLKVTRMTLQTKETQQSAGMRPQHKLQQPLKVTNMSNRNSPLINHELSTFYFDADAIPSYLAIPLRTSRGESESLQRPDCLSPTWEDEEVVLI